MGALIFEGEKLLLVERGREPLKGWWSLPGGGVETGERLAAAIIREVLEETGLEVDPLDVFEIFERIMPDSGGRTEYHYVLIDYICRVTGGTLCAGDDVSAVRWVTHSEVAGYALTEGTLEVIERAFRKHESR